MTTARWPIHPQPIGEGIADHESVTSWMLRQAHANGMGYREFLAGVLGPGEWRRKDLELLDEPLLTNLAGWGSVEGGGVSLLRGTITQWLGLISLEKADRKSWVSSLWATRYCSVCLTEDEIQYLRGIWRLHVSPLCLRHKVLLENACSECGRTQPIAAFVREDGIGKCRHCGKRLVRAPSVKPQHHEALLRYVDALPEIFMMKGKLRERFGWPHSDREFFKVLRVFIRFMGLAFIQTAELRRLKEYYGLSEDGKTDWRKSEAVGCILLNESMKLILDWPRPFLGFLDARQNLFNEVAAEYGSDLPQSLAEFVVKRQGNHTNRSQQRLYFDPDQETRVRKAVGQLIKLDREIGPCTIQQLTRVDYRTLLKRPELRSVILEGKQRQQEQRLKRVADAIDLIRIQGCPNPSVRAIAAYLGHSTMYLRDSPALLDLVEKARR